MFSDSYAYSGDYYYMYSMMLEELGMMKMGGRIRTPHVGKIRTPHVGKISTPNPGTSIGEISTPNPGTTIGEISTPNPGATIGEIGTPTVGVITTPKVVNGVTCPAPAPGVVQPEGCATVQVTTAKVVGTTQHYYWPKVGLNNVTCPVVKTNVVLPAGCEKKLATYLVLL